MKKLFHRSFDIYRVATIYIACVGLLLNKYSRVKFLKKIMTVFKIRMCLQDKTITISMAMVIFSIHLCFEKQLTSY